MTDDVTHRCQLTSLNPPLFVHDKSAASIEVQFMR